MDAARFTNGHTFAVERRIEFRAAPEEPSVAANFGIPGFNEREARGFTGLRYR
jgi:hypothetical protein